MHLVHTFLQVGGDDVGIGALEHHSNAAHTFSLAVDGHGAEALGRPEAYAANVADVHGHAATVGHHDAADVLGALYHTLRPYIIGTALLLNITGTCVLVVAAQRLEHVANGELHGGKHFGVDGYFILLEIAAETVDLHNARYACKAAAHYPILNGAQFHDVVLAFVFIVDTQYVLVDFAQARSDGHHFGRAQFLRYLGRDILNLFVDELAGLQRGHALLEHDRDER